MVSVAVVPIAASTRRFSLNTTAKGGQPHARNVFRIQTFRCRGFGWACQFSESFAATALTASSRVSYKLQTVWRLVMVRISQQ